MPKVSKVKLRLKIARESKIKKTISTNCINEENVENRDPNKIENRTNKASTQISSTLSMHVLQPIEMVDEVESGELHELVITKEKEQIWEEKNVGRRIINVSFYTKRLLEICNHGPLGCTADNIILAGEKQNGLISNFTFKCKMCNSHFVIESDNYDENFLNINACAVAGTIAIGCGKSQLEELFSSMNLPSLSDHIYTHNHNIIGKHWEKVALESMIAAGQKEKQKAVAAGKITKEGHGKIDVIIDGCWSKRSYKKNYSALSGAAAVIGKNTGEILFLGVKNKYCQVCAMACKNNIDPKEHNCFKNYEGPSTGMESAILVEGFKSSIEQHGLVYERLISDGDSSTYSKILEARPYENITVEKIECRNHLMRNFCNKMQALTKETKYLIKHRKCLTLKTILSMRAAIIKSVKKHKENSDVQLLFEDILRCHHHAFGNHSGCKSYFCKEVGVVKTAETVPSDFFTSALWQRINFIVQSVAAHARSLICDVDSNRVECFHSIVAKFVGGKRINFSKKNSYQFRVNAVAAAFNTKKTISRLYKSVNTGKSPTGKLKKLEDRRIKKATYNNTKRKPKRRLLYQMKEKDKDYGEGCTKPDMDKETFEKMKIIFVNNLKKTEVEIENIQRNTILQSNSGEWLELRRSLLTASNFGRIIKRRDDTSCVNFVKELLYKGSNLSQVESIKHGRENEKTALNQLSSQVNKKINPCGLFIDKEKPFLGASPDGLIDGDTVVEIKCPITAHKIGIEEAINQNKITFWKKNKQINKNHNWYYQIQGQMHVTQRNVCIFAVWANENEPLKVEVVAKDDDFWRDRMEPKLQKFYMDCVLPELVDPRHPRNLQIRDPECILEALRKKREKKKDV